MRRPPAPPEDRVARLLVGLTGLTLLASATLAADLGRAHMALCGAHPHCVGCLTASYLALSGLAALAIASRRTAFARVVQ